MENFFFLKTRGLELGEKGSSGRTPERAGFHFGEGKETTTTEEMEPAKNDVV